MELSYKEIVRNRLKDIYQFGEFYTDGLLAHLNEIEKLANEPEKVKQINEVKSLLQELAEKITLENKESVLMVSATIGMIRGLARKHNYKEVDKIIPQ